MIAGFAAVAGRRVANGYKMILPTSVLGGVQSNSNVTPCVVPLRVPVWVWVMY